LIIGGTEDRHTLQEDTEALYESAAEPKEIFMIEGAQHENLYRFAGVEYEKRVIAFLSKHLHQGATSIEDTSEAE
jgi:uncharacterized protein